MKQSLIGADLASSERRARLKRVAKAALDLSLWAAEGRCDYSIASQIQLVTRYFAQAAEPSQTFPDFPAILDYLGSQIQTVVGRATQPPGPPATKAVEPPEETKLEAV